MPSWREIFPEKWLRASTIGHKRVRVTIDRVRQEQLFNPTTKKHESKITIAFVGKELRLIANKTQLEAITKIAGTDDYTHWSGVNVALTTTLANNGKDTIVINPTSGAAPAPAQAARQPRFEEETFERPQASAPAPEEGEDDSDLWEVDGARPEEATPDARPAPQDSGARPATNGARPVNNSNGPCPECHAPVGRPHGSGCKAANSGARPAESGARPGGVDPGPPAEPSARPAAAPENSGARPEVSQPQLIFGGQVYADVARISQEIKDLPKEVSELIRKARNAEQDSSTKMSLTYYRSLITLLVSTFSLDPDEEAELLLTALIGRQINADARPGQLVHGYLIKPLRDQDEAFALTINDLLFYCRDIVMAHLEAE